MSSILYYITGHGYGHAVRSSLVIRALMTARPDLEIHARTTAPEWLFPKTVRYSRQSIDVGIVQSDSLVMNLEATVEACRALQDDAPRTIETELAFVRAHDVGLIVGDIPPLCFEIAARASVPSVVVGNFSWDDIYRSYADEYPGFRPVIDTIEKYYAKATLALTLPYPCDMDIFPRREPIPWIARVSPLRREEARQLLSLPRSTILVLMSFGGLGLERLPWNKLSQLQGYHFVTTGSDRKPGGNVVMLSDPQPNYENLVRAADVVVSKIGYGIVADVIAERVPMLYTERGEFPEYPRLVQALDDCATVNFIPQADLLAGNLEPHLKRLLNRTPHWPAVELDGAEVAAKKILALM